MPELLTGEDIYQIYSEVQAQFINYKLRSWAEITPSVRMLYNLVADTLNARYLAPLQGKLEELQAAFRRLKIIDLDIQKEQDAELAQMDVELAAIQRKNDALQGLVQGWQSLLQERDEVDVLSLAEVDDWYERWSNLKQRTAQLLNVEQEG